MTSLFGHGSLALALIFAVLMSVLPKRQKISATLMLGFTTLALLALGYAYVVSDFSILNVLRNSHSDKPLLYKIAGVWSNHEGSMLLWVWVLSAWTFALSRAALPAGFHSRVLSSQGMISAGFFLFVLMTSNPFVRLEVPAPEGLGLNPVLQDPALALHPPLLYAGYVGFSIPFSFALAALWEKKIDRDFALALRNWVLLAWSFLTCGIALGSFWAYYELGWGGFWFWDPVENASLLPWLAGTALLHSLAVLARRGTLSNWTIFLAILAFSFSLLGAFLVRSGVLTSVHAFAADPARGVFLLTLFGVFTGGALLLYALRAPEMAQEKLLSPISRETALLLNNVFMFTFAATVAIGTLYPVFLTALEAGSISVGAPYYNMMIAPVIFPFALLMAVAPYAAWGGGNGQALAGHMSLPFLLTVAVLFVVPWEPVMVLGFASAAIIFFAVAGDFVVKTQRLKKWRGLPGSFYGMTLAHLGFALLIAGVTGATQMDSEKILWMAEEERVVFAGHDVAFLGVRVEERRNHTATQGLFVVDGKVMAPEKRWYPVSDRMMSETALRRDGLGMLYLVMGDEDRNGRWVLRMYHHPLLLLIFIGAGLMAAGGFVSAVYKSGAGRRK